ncbi:hypothetical protein [Flavobacterium stagni]|uniref:Uncharacterized protein n=1 Tax=Flavobacterium stagni TaxID=2506421 RepID=A0A4Q1KBH7_9FLAO|nr:hypothetical protein [Flavobacterium stagni]RXR24217.1 hypothetical protein EQG61_01910 [Flavobacterium stagni]
MNKVVILLFLFLIKNEEYAGLYEYSANENSAMYLKESINLFPNNTFTYNYAWEFSKFTVNGNYNINQDTLTLDSYPQRDKIIVNESFKGSKKKSIFTVKNKREEKITYHLTLFFENDSVARFENQFGDLIVNSRALKSFYVQTTQGITSPTYFILGKNVNNFKITMETNRVFENEKWVIKNNTIRHKGMNGEFLNYFLSKK